MGSGILSVSLEVLIKVSRAAHLKSKVFGKRLFCWVFYDIEKLTTEFVNGFRDASCLWR